MIGHDDIVKWYDHRVNEEPCQPHPGSPREGGPSRAFRRTLPTMRRGDPVIKRKGTRPGPKPKHLLVALPSSSQEYGAGRAAIIRPQSEARNEPSGGGSCKCCNQQKPRTQKTGSALRLLSCLL
jgi:hypothetical protein